MLMFAQLPTAASPLETSVLHWNETSN
jgi:hypothetical protein